jgi:hypothetical protein
MFLAALASCRTSAPAASPPPQVATKPPATGPVAKTAKEDCEALMNFVVPFAQKMLTER